MREKLYDVGDGRKLTIHDIAYETGAPYETVRTRVARGYRGSRLFQRFKRWHLGLSESDLRCVADYARQRSAKAAAMKFNVPTGAINCLLRGETWRVL